MKKKQKCQKPVKLLIICGLSFFEFLFISKQKNKKKKNQSLTIQSLINVFEQLSIDFYIFYIFLIIIFFILFFYQPHIF